MKKSNELILIVALMVAAFVVPNLHAQNPADTPEGGAAAPHAGARGEKARDMLGQMAKELDLTDAQKAQMKPILKQAAEERKALMEDTSLTMEQKREKGMALRKSTEDKVDAILTSEQKVKAKEFRAAHGGPEGGPAGKKGGKKKKAE